MTGRSDIKLFKSRLLTDFCVTEFPEICRVFSEKTLSQVDSQFIIEDFIRQVFKFRIKMEERFEEIDTDSTSDSEDEEIRQELKKQEMLKQKYKEQKRKELQKLRRRTAKLEKKNLQLQIASKGKKQTKHFNPTFSELQLKRDLGNAIRKGKNCIMCSNQWRI